MREHTVYMDASVRSIRRLLAKEKALAKRDQRRYKKSVGGRRLTTEELQEFRVKIVLKPRGVY